MYPEIPEEVLASQDKFTVCVGAAVPVPVSASVELLGWALLVNVSVAFAEPVACGLKVIVNDVLWPAGIVTGSCNPLIVNAELLIPAAVTVTLAPLAFKVPVAVPLDPTVTSLRFSVAGVTVKDPVA